MKEYFSHDYNARNDPKLQNVFMKQGLKGIGIYWCIVEMLYENNGELLHTECERIAFELRINIDEIKSIINDFELFKSDRKKFWSDSVKERLKLRELKSEKARQSASVRWENANAKRTQCDGNAIKLNKNKRKENKKESIKEKLDFEYNKEYENILHEWFDYKKSRKESYKITDSKKKFYSQLFNLSGGNKDMAQRIIDQSMANNWAGIFPLKDFIGQIKGPVLETRQNSPSGRLQQ